MSRNEWDADIEMTDVLARRLIEKQHPALAPVSLSMLGVGWDNVAYLVNGEYVFRFPRRKFAADLILNEVRCLKMLAPHLTLPVPVPIITGTPADDYPYSFAAYRRLEGETACGIEWTDLQRMAVAAPLGAFLRSLHNVPVDADTLAWAPHDDIRRADIRYRLPRLLERLHVVGERFPAIPVNELTALAQQLSLAQPAGDRLHWVHGDLYARHLLAGPDHAISGIIDWGDVHVGDPAVDLGILYSFLPAAARTRFIEAYGAIDADARNRARFRAIHYGAILAIYGVDTSDAAISNAGLTALQFALDDVQQ